MDGDRFSGVISLALNELERHCTTLHFAGVGGCLVVCFSFRSSFGHNAIRVAVRLRCKFSLCGNGTLGDGERLQSKSGQTAMLAH